MNDKTIDNIKAGKFNGKQLENYYLNAKRLGNIELQNAAKESLKVIDSRSYSKRFVKPIKDKVEIIATERGSYLIAAKSAIFVRR